MAGSYLDVPQVDPSVQHGCDEGVPQHMRVCPGNPDSGGIGQLPKAPGGSMAIHPAAAAVEQDRPFWAIADGLVDSPADRRWQGDQDDPAAFAAYPQHPVTMFFTKVGDVGGSGLEDPQAEQPEHRYEREVAPGG